MANVPIRSFLSAVTLLLVMLTCVSAQDPVDGSGGPPGATERPSNAMDDPFGSGPLIKEATVGKDRDEAIRSLKELVSDQSNRKACDAAHGLLELAGADAAKLLVEFLDKKDRESQVLRAAIRQSDQLPPEVMAWIGDRAYLPVLKKRMAEADAHSRTYLEACSRACGAAPTRVVEISEEKPGGFRPDSANGGRSKDAAGVLRCPRRRLCVRLRDRAPSGRRKDPGSEPQVLQCE